jgi:hypothetical protein
MRFLALAVLLLAQSAPPFEITSVSQIRGCGTS